MFHIRTFSDARSIPVRLFLGLRRLAPVALATRCAFTWNICVFSGNAPAMRMLGLADGFGRLLFGVRMRAFSL